MSVFMLRVFMLQNILPIIHVLVNKELLPL